MFERYTETARRVIFHARCEASAYGSPYIETEHLLLGLLKEDPSLANLLPVPWNITELRREIEKLITPRERISTSVELPLAGQCKRALYLAAEEANRLASSRVGTEHLLLGLLQIPECVVAEVIRADKLHVAKLRATFAVSCASPSAKPEPRPRETPPGEEGVELFLAALRNGDSPELESFFVSESCVLDASGKSWRGQSEIIRNYEIILAPFSGRNARPKLESCAYLDSFLWFSTLLWTGVRLPGFSPLDLFRMSLVFAADRGLLIYLIQTTAIGRGAFVKTTNA